jgi:hypothetical protein
MAHLNNKQRHCELKCNKNGKKYCENSLKRKKLKLMLKEKSLFLYFVILCINLSFMNVVYGQAWTRDPRFYSREGDPNPPNPGDEDYR